MYRGATCHGPPPTDMVSPQVSLRFAPAAPSCSGRVAYDRLVADFEALECVRSQRQRREASAAKQKPPDGVASSGALAAEEATERYLSKMPAANQTRDAVRDGAGPHE